MSSKDGEYPDYLARSDDDDEGSYSGPPVEELEERIAELEEKIDSLEEKLGETSDSAVIAFYLLGTAIAVVLSWSRSASILWCILHGLLSWVYVIYFACTR